MDSKRFSKRGIVVGLVFSASYVGLNVIARLKKGKEAADKDLQKDRYENAGEAVTKREKGIYEKSIKPVFDKVLSFFGLLMLSPLYIIISLAIFIDDPGPVLFTQKRVGKNKEFFRLHKFRSMKMSTPHDVPTHMLENPEQYITCVGKFLRKYSLDELPQIWDIFMGNMSIIGPRPALWNQTDLVAERDKYGANDVKPGLTGWAQINGRDQLEIPFKAKLDGEYIAKESFLFDLQCFFKTILSVAGHKGVVEGNTDLSVENTVSLVEPGFNESVVVDFSQHRKILITGADSYIGESFKAYAEKKYPENFTIDTIDMIDGSWRKKDFSGYDTVFHVAGLAHADVGNIDEATKRKYYEINTDLAIETAQKAKDDKVKQFVFMSSMIIYGDSARFGKKKQITKYTEPNPANFYGDSKWQADKGVRELADTFFHVLVLRPPMIYGKESKGNYKTLASLAKKLPVFPDIDNERSMLHIDNLCEFLCMVMLVGKGGVFFPQNGEYTRTSKMVKEISLVSGKKVIISSVFNPLILLASKMPGRISGLVNKAFGNMIYDQKLSIYPGIEYRVVNLKDSIACTESREFVETESLNEEKPKALMLASVASMIDQFNMDNIKILLNMGYDVDVVADFVNGGTITQERIQDLRKRLENLGVTVYHVSIPRKVSNLTKIFDAYKKVRVLCEKRHYKIVHCHSPIGGVVARLAVKDARNSGTKVIYTAHGFHFYEGAPKKNWLLFYPVEKICSKWTDILITINKEDYYRAKKDFYAGKVVYIPGVGIDTRKFHPDSIDIEKKRTELGVTDSDIMLLSVGELSLRKNHEIVIKAIKEIGNSNIKYFICGKGELESYLRDLIKSLDLESQVILLGYRADVLELYQIADLFVFPSHQEGLPVALMEAIACQVPIICSKIRGNEDLVRDSKCFFDDYSVGDLVECLREITGEKKTLHAKMEQSVEQNYMNLKKFDLNNVSRKMAILYKE